MSRLSPDPMLDLRLYYTSAKACLWLVGGATGTYSYFGLVALEAEPDFGKRATFALFATAITVIFYVVWSGVIEQVPKLSRRARLHAAPLVAAALLFSIGVSSFLNLAGAIGEQALVRDLEGKLTQASDAVASVRNQVVRSFEGARSSVRLIESKYDALAQDEEATGASSGSGGTGAIWSVLNQVKTVMRDAGREVDLVSERAERMTGDALARLAAMRDTLADPSLDAAGRSKKFASEAEALRRILVDLSAVDVTPVLRQAIATAKAVAPPALSSNKGFAARQEAAIERIKNAVAELGESSDFGARPPPPAFLGQAIRTSTVYSATLEHALDYVPIVVAVVLVDIAPLLILWLITVAKNDIERNDGRNAVDAARRYSFAEMLEMRQLWADEAGEQPPPVKGNGLDKSPLTGHPVERADSGTVAH